MIDTVINGDCLEILKGVPNDTVDLIITDPPYPDYHKELYQYTEGLLDGLKRFECKQLIFWSAKVDFPLDYTAIHIWDKTVGCASQYERIFERNGSKAYRMFRECMINNVVNARMKRDIFTGHPSQKPTALMKRLIELYSKPNDVILDPFCGSGTTCVAAKQLNRHFIGIEIDAGYCEIANKRLAEMQLSLVS